MVEKKTEENPQETEISKTEKTQPQSVEIQITPDTQSKMSEVTPTPAETLPKMADIPKPAESQKPEIPVKPVSATSPRLIVPGFMKMEPNDPYRRILPAVLFVLTFVTVMSMLLIYMDNVAESAQQFRLNMSHDYELSRISASSAPLVTYVRELHLAPRRAPHPDPPPAPTHSVAVLDKHLGPIFNGTFIELLPSGPQSQTTLYLEGAREWGGVVARAAARDFFRLRTTARALHACLSNTEHPREVAYQELENQEPVFRSRVLCLPIYTVLLAGDAAHAHYLLLGGEAAYPALTHLPYSHVDIKVIEVISSDPSYRNKTTNFLATKNYTVAADFTHSIMYVLH